MSNAMISVIIPTIDEEESIDRLLPYLQRESSGSSIEMIVSDGGSHDRTVDTARRHGARVIRCDRCGRAVQMNRATHAARGSILYFLHADTFPPRRYGRIVCDAVKNGIDVATFRLGFDDPHFFLRANAWFTRFDIDAFRFGDQSLLVTRALFDRCGGFDERLVLFEDQEIVGRLRRAGRFALLPQSVTTSARCYRDNGVYRLQMIYAYLCALYRCGVSQDCLRRVAKRWIYGRRGLTESGSVS